LNLSEKENGRTNVCLSDGMWRVNRNPNPCTDLDEILHAHPHLSKEGFDADFCRVFIPAFTFTAVSVLPSSKRSVIFLIRFPFQDIFLIHFFIFIVYIKPLVHINKQFSIDSFLDWVGQL